MSLKDLQIKTPIRLAGTRGEIGIPFGMRRDTVVTAATLTLNFAYSPALLGDLSQLVVILNGEVVRTLPLQSDGAGGSQVAITGQSGAVPGRRQPAQHPSRRSLHPRL